MVMLMQWLMTKNGVAICRLATELLSYKIGEKIDTVENFSALLSVGRGTVQSALKFLAKNNAIQLEPRGHLGTYIESLDYEKLWKISDINYISGLMPLPRSRRYEGLATAIYKSFQDRALPFNLAFMRGGEIRIQALKDGKADFAIVSGLTAQAELKENSGLRKLIDFGPDSLVSGHRILFSKPGFSEITDGMIVGIDQASSDMRLLTEYECSGKNVEFMSFPYHQTLHYLNSGKIDAAIWSTDELTDRNIDVPSSRLSTQKAKELNDINTHAILITGHSRKMLDNLLLDILCPKQIREIQTSVMNEKIEPVY